MFDFIGIKTAQVALMLAFPNFGLDFYSCGCLLSIFVVGVISFDKRGQG